MTSQPPPSATRLRETFPCPACGGVGVVEGPSKEDLAKYGLSYGPAICAGCDGCGQLARCGSCCDRIPANQDYDFCGPCEREHEAHDSAAEGYRLGRWAT